MAMRILLLNDLHDPRIGSSVRLCYQLARQFASAGHVAEIVSTSEKAADSGPTEIEGVRVHRLHSSYNPRWRSWVSLDNPRVREPLARIYREFRPDIVHAHVYSAGRPAALIAGWRRIPLVLTEHNSAFPRRLLTPRQVRMARRALSSAALVMPVSRALQRGIEDYGIRASFQIVPNVVDSSVFHPVDVDDATSVGAHAVRVAVPGSSCSSSSPQTGATTLGIRSTKG
jgi:glycosyltransferase involved in cell wall biosynthesis